MRGLPGSGKSTMAKQLAGETGKILYFENNKVSSDLQNNNQITNEENVIKEIEERNFQEFSEEILKGTDILVVDNNNLCESEYLKLIRKA